ncbi:MAG: hypothetical protein H6621_07570 [Halobacteriovoraceae bacterium]|nr:hypothetical protein [Halobacteriovoraceae bacterium]
MQKFIFLIYFIVLLSSQVGFSNCPNFSGKYFRDSSIACESDIKDRWGNYPIPYTSGITFFAEKDEIEITQVDCDELEIKFLDTYLPGKNSRNVYFHGQDRQSIKINLTEKYAKISDNEIAIKRRTGLEAYSVYAEPAFGLENNLLKIKLTKTDDMLTINSFWRHFDLLGYIVPWTFKHSMSCQFQKEN